MRTHIHTHLSPPGGSAHVRERFFVCLALAGGALLLASLGAGRYTAARAVAAARKRR